MTAPGGSCAALKASRTWCRFFPELLGLGIKIPKNGNSATKHQKSSEQFRTYIYIIIYMYIRIFRYHVILCNYMYIYIYTHISIHLSFEQENCSDLQNMEMAPLQGAPRCAGSQVLPVPAITVTSCPPPAGSNMLKSLSTLNRDKNSKEWQGYCKQRWTWDCLKIDDNSDK